MKNIGLIASLAIFRKLYDKKETVYDILFSFIIHILKNNNIMNFSATEMKNWLKENYSFDIPESIIKTSLKKRENIKREKGMYKYTNLSFEDELVSDMILINNLSSNVLNKFFDGMKKLLKKENLSDQEETDILNSLYDFLLENNFHDIKYGNEIYNVIIHLQNDNKVKEYFNIIKEGLILYNGLTYSIDINSLKNWTNKLVIYLDISILFNAIGYNGDLFKDLFLDFYNLIRDINIKYQNKFNKKIIELKYFKETRKQINDYFSTAISIIEENKYANNDTAMESIIRGCKFRSDISDKESDFFNTLEKNYEIYEETNDDFFINDNHSYNLDFLIIEKLFNEKDPEMDSNKIKIYTNIMQHINVLRKEKKECYFENVGYIFITNNSNILHVSKNEDIKKIYDIPIVINLDYITNILWIKLNKGFKGETPKNIDVIVQIQKAVSTSLHKILCDEFDNLLTSYKAGRITEDALKDRIVTIKSKMLSPEKVQSDNIDELYNILSVNSLEHLYSERELERIRHIETKESNKKLQKDNKTLQENNKTLQENNKTLQEDYKILQEDNKTLQENNKTLQEDYKILQEDNKTLQEEYKTLQENNKILQDKVNKANKIKRIRKIVLKVICILLILAFFIYISIDKEYQNIYIIISSSLTILPFLLSKRMRYWIIK